ncbi:MAG: twin-arginine translocase subunit TatC [Prevotella sp.]|nr:twin-arginine translocase subunit TatC [Prevotella sp.]
MAEEDQELTFWEHLDVLRGDILRILAVIVVFGLVAFYFKEELFSIVLAPKSSDFITYRLIGGEPFNVGLMNTGLTEQFMIHMKTALFFGLLCASPYVLYVLYRFISPALYQNEKLYASKVVGSAYVMFMIGVAVNYFIIFPLTVHFLGTYQVSPEVANMLTLQSYMDTMLLMSLVFGVVFEIPVVSWLLALFGLLRSDWMKQFRRHAVVAILIVAAVITPTADMFTLLVVSLPIWLLYEVSIIIVKMTEKPEEKED